MNRYSLLIHLPGGSSHGFFGMEFEGTADQLACAIAERGVVVRSSLGAVWHNPSELVRVVIESGGHPTAQPSAWLPEIH